MTKANGVMRIGEIIHENPPQLLILFDRGQEDIVKIMADVLGQAYCFVDSLDEVAGRSDGVIVGLKNDLIPHPETIHNIERTSITAHPIDVQDLRDEHFTSYCDYEYLYNQNNFSRRDLARFLGFVLGQIKPHDDLTKKTRTTLLSTTFPDIRGALPNLDILSVGADSIELRVDLLKESPSNGTKQSVPSLKYVGEQVMVLRQRTELPIIFTTRCTNENGRFPMDDPLLFYQYLRKAIQWGCEYVDGLFFFDDICSAIN
jgi:3-dehydroquinate dehydratase-1